MPRVTVGGVGLHYLEWGSDKARPPVICVHGLTRNAHDFDALGAALAPFRRVISIDMAGRGGSDRLANESLYNYPLYLAHILGFMDALGIARVDWVGTSMGGLIGMSLAAAAPQRIGRMVVNDVGPFIPKAALDGIAAYIGKPVSFADLTEAEAYFRVVNAGFGPMGDAAWRDLAATSVEPGPDGRLVRTYDPALAAPFQATQADVALWPIWDTIKCPILLLRGGNSPLLLRATALGMVARGDVELIEYPGVGHAPSLRVPEQIAAVVDWFAKTDA